MRMSTQCVGGLYAWECTQMHAGLRARVCVCVCVCKNGICTFECAYVCAHAVYVCDYEYVRACVLVCTCACAE